MKVHKFLDILKDTFGEDIIQSQQRNGNRGNIRVKAESIYKISEFLFTRNHFRLITASGYDSKEGLEIIYHYMLDEAGFVLNINVVLPHSNPEIESITPLIEGANWIEREMMELLGIKFTNHPDPKKLISDENWDEGVYPYRREIKEV